MRHEEAQRRTGRGSLRWLPFYVAIAVLHCNGWAAGPNGGRRGGNEALPFHPGSLLLKIQGHA